MMTATFLIGDERYMIDALGDGLHTLASLDPKEISRGECASETDIEVPDSEDTSMNSGETGGEMPVISSSGSARVDVLVLYTHEAAQAVPNIFNTIDLAVLQTNTSLANSDISTAEASVHLAHTRLFSFQERLPNLTHSEAIVDARDRLAADSWANYYRDQYGADLVVLLTSDAYGGYAGIVQSIPATDATPFAIVALPWATTTYTFAHEAGHMLGGRHQRCAHYPWGACEPVPYPSGFAFGYSWSWSWHIRTDIMHVLRSGATRVDYFSNPDVTYAGQATGTAFENVALRIRQVAPIVSAFRTPWIPPLQTQIMGPDYGCAYEFLTWEATSTGGEQPYSYVWEESTDGFNYAQVGTSSMYSQAMPPFSDLYFRVTGTSSDSQTDVAFKFVENREGMPECIWGRIAQEGVDEHIPKDFALHQAHPNPFNPLTRISFDLPEESHVRITVYDMLGRVVSDIVNNRYYPGRHFVSFDATGLSSGTYFYRMYSEVFTETRRFTVAK